MAEHDPSERTGEFGDEGNPPEARAPTSPATREFGGEGNPPGLRRRTRSPGGRRGAEGREPAGPTRREGSAAGVWRGPRRPVG